MKILSFEECLEILTEDPYILGKSLGFGDLTELHNQWIKRMIFSNRDFTLLAHRGSFKSTCLTIALSIKLILYPDKNIILLRKTDVDVKETLMQTYKIMNSSVFKYIVKLIYGVDLLFTSVTSFSLNTNLNTSAKGANQLVGMGIKTSITGKHADLIVTDDICNIKDRVSKAERNMTNDIVSRLDSVETHYVPNTEITGIINEKVENNSYVNQLPESIMSRVEEKYTKETDFEYYKNLISTQMEQSSNEIVLKFENITSLIDKLDNSTSQQFSDVIKYIRFSDGNIILGQIGSPFSVKISNSKISFLQNEVEVAYMNNNTLYITSGEFINTLQLGNFTFCPRSNGNLSFFKNKGN